MPLLHPTHLRGAIGVYLVGMSLLADCENHYDLLSVSWSMDWFRTVKSAVVNSLSDNGSSSISINWVPEICAGTKGTGSNGDKSRK
jgi:hypothetical protein